MFTEKQLNIITGLLLGDGHLSLKGTSKNASLIVRRATKDIEYLKYHADVLKEHVTESGVKSKNRFDSRTNKYYPYCEFTLKASPELTEIYKKWYKDKKKVVPTDLKLNGEIIATWFCDDGSIKKTEKNYFQIQFATNGFSINEVEFLRRLLSDRYSELVGTCSVSKSNQKIIALSDFVARKLIKDIDPFFPPGMERKRKWKGIEEFPPAHQSCKLSSDERRRQVSEFLENVEKFYLVDLAKYLNWKVNRSDGRYEWDSQNAKRYLKKYLDNGILKLIKKDHGGSYYVKQPL